MKICAESKNDDKRKQYVLLVSKEPATLTDVIIKKFHHVYVAEISKVTPTVKGKTFAKLYSGDKMSLKSIIHYKEFNKKVWLPFLALPSDSKYKIVDDERKRLTQKYFSE